MIWVDVLAPTADEGAIAAEALNDEIGESGEKTVGMLNRAARKEHELKEGGLHGALTHELTPHGRCLRPNLVGEGSDAIERGVEHLGKQFTRADEEPPDLVVRMLTGDELIAHDGHAESESEADAVPATTPCR